MHVLHRPHLPHAAAIAAACAALVLSLLLASTLTDLASTSAGGPPTATPTPPRSTWSGAGWNLNPFMNLLRSPVPVQWTLGS